MLLGWAAEQEILTLLTEDPGYTMSQLAELLGISRKAVAVCLKKLKESGLIKRILFILGIYTSLFLLKEVFHGE